MKNIYDILVNFKKIPYEFYEWNKEDDERGCRKIIRLDDRVMPSLYHM